MSFSTDSLGKRASAASRSILALHRVSGQRHDVGATRPTRQALHVQSKHGGHAPRPGDPRAGESSRRTSGVTESNPHTRRRHPGHDNILKMCEPAIRAALGTLLPAPTRAAALHLCGADALVFYQLDPVEHARRQAAEAERLDAFRPIEFLMTLPPGIRIPRTSLEERYRAEPRRLPRGAAHTDRTSVTRLAVRPLRVDLIVASAPGPRTGLKSAGCHAPYCRRAMLLGSARGVTTQFLAEADFHSIGVFTGGPEQLEMPLVPAASLPMRHTAAAWLLVEEMYQHLAAASALA